MRSRSLRGWTTRTCVFSAGACLAFTLLAGCGGARSPHRATSRAGLPTRAPARPSPFARKGNHRALWPADAVETETDGWEFRPYTDIVVTALGYFDGSGDGLRHDHEVAIFDADSRDAIATAQVHPDSVLQGAFRWESIRPVLLLTGKSYVVAGSSCPPFDPEARHGRDVGTRADAWPTTARFTVAWASPTDHFRRPSTGPNFKFKPCVDHVGDAIDDERVAGHDRGLPNGCRERVPRRLCTGVRQQVPNTRRLRIRPRRRP